MPEHVLLENFQKLLDENRDVMKIDFSDFADTKDLPDKNIGRRCKTGYVSEWQSGYASGCNPELCEFDFHF